MGYLGEKKNRAIPSFPSCLNISCTSLLIIPGENITPPAHANALLFQYAKEPTPAPSEPVKAPQEVPTPDDTEKAETKPPPEPEPTPRIQDIANSEERQADIEADKENERVPSPKEPENTDLITRREEQKKAEQNQESSSNEEDAEVTVKLTGEATCLSCGAIVRPTTRVPPNKCLGLKGSTNVNNYSMVNDLKFGMGGVVVYTWSAIVRQSGRKYSGTSQSFACFSYYSQMKV